MPEIDPPPGFKFRLSTRAMTICVAAMFEGGIVVLALFLGGFLDPSPPEQVLWTWQGVLWGLAAVVPMLVLMLAVERLPLPPFQRLSKVVDQILAPLFAECSLVDLAIISILAGLGEEALFRGVVQSFLTEHMNIWLALVLASVLFGLAHMVTVTYAILAALMGMYLGGLMIYTENLLPPIICHAVYDFVALLYLTRQHRRAGDLPLAKNRSPGPPDAS